MEVFLMSKEKRFEKVYTQGAGSVEIWVDKETGINLDGELRTGKEIVFKIADEKLRFFYPKGLTFKPKAEKKATV